MTVPAYSVAYDEAFARLSPHAVITTGAGSPHTTGTGAPGSWYIDAAATPQRVYSWTGSQWILFGQLHPNAAAVPTSPRLYMAAMLLCVRAFTLPNAALGVTGGYDMGAIYVGRVSQDIAAWVQGFRGGTLPVSQRWPTVAEVKQRLTISGTEMDVETQMALDAAIEQVSTYVTGAFGVAG